jgi:hypothetical protein
MPADISHVGDPAERQRLRLMVLDKLSRSRHICGAHALRAALPVDSTKSKGAARRCLVAGALRDIVSAIKRTPESRLAQVASNPPCSPTREAAA